MARVKIFVTGQYGGDDAGEAARTVVTEIKQRISSPEGEFCSVDLQIRVNLYVSGEVTTFVGVSGPSNLRSFLAKGYVSCDITMGREVWMGGRARVRDFMVSALSTAVREMAAKLKKQAVSLDAAALATFLRWAGTLST